MLGHKNCAWESCKSFKNLRLRGVIKLRKQKLKFAFVAGGILQGLPLFESSLFQECTTFVRELLEGFSKAHVWVIGFSTDLQQTKTREQYMSMWDPICQKHTPLDRRISPTVNSSGIPQSMENGNAEAARLSKSQSTGASFYFGSLEKLSLAFRQLSLSSLS